MADELKPFGWVYQCVDDEQWQFYRQQLKRADGSICPGKPLYDRPSPPALMGAPERLWLGAADADGDHAVWFEPNEGGTEYVLALAIPEQEPVAVTVFCPKCAAPHVDEGEWAIRPHKTHQCQSCGHEWRPFPFATVGIAHPASKTPEAEGQSAEAALEVAVKALERIVRQCRQASITGAPYLTAVQALASIKEKAGG